MTTKETIEACADNFLDSAQGRITPSGVMAIWDFVSKYVTQYDSIKQYVNRYGSPNYANLNDLAKGQGGTILLIGGKGFLHIRHG